MAIYENLGSWLTGERTQNRLLHDPNYEAINARFVIDQELPDYFSYPWTGNRFMQGKVVVPKGRILANKVDTDGLSVFQRDPMDREMHTVVTLANGGADSSFTRNYGGTYTNYANKPLGITIKNVFRNIPGTAEFDYPLVIRKAHIGIPCFDDNYSLAAAFNWSCAYNPNGTASANKLRAGSFVKSDANGKFVPWISGVDDEDQKVGKVIEVNKNVPDIYLARTVLDVMSSIIGMRTSIGNQRIPISNPYNPADPMMTLSDMNTGDTTGGSRSGDLNSLRKPYQYDALGHPWDRSDYSYLMKQEHLLQISGVPGLHDAVEMYKKEVTETFAPADASYTYDAVNDVTTLQLGHTMVMPDPEGIAFPDSAHPFPSKLLLTQSNGVDPTAALVENKDYIVTSLQGKVYISGTDGTEEWSITYTHLEDVQSGIPSNLNFQGVAGELMISIWVP